MSEPTNYPTLPGALRVLASTDMRPFDDSDFDAFPGVNVEAGPMIGDADGFLVILDGSTLVLYTEADIEEGEPGCYYRLTTERPRRVREDFSPAGGPPAVRS